MKHTKEINLIPIDRVKKIRKLIFAGTLSVILLVSLLSIFGYIIPQLEVLKLQEENKQLEGELKLVQSKSLYLEEIKKKEKKLEGLKVSFSAVQKEKYSVLSFLERLKPHIPQGGFVSSLSMNSGGTLNVTFEAPDPVYVPRLLVKLRQSGLFESVELSTFPINKGPHNIGFSLMISEKKQISEDEE